MPMKKMILELQSQLAKIDFREFLERKRRKELRKERDRRRRGIEKKDDGTIISYVMVAELKDISVEIRMDGNLNHAAPHVHIAYGTDHHAASFALKDGERLVGELPRKYDRIIEAWIEKHNANLNALWHEMRGSGKIELLLATIQKETDKEKRAKRVKAEKKKKKKRQAH